MISNFYEEFKPVVAIKSNTGCISFLVKPGRSSGIEMCLSAPGIQIVFVTVTQEKNRIETVQLNKPKTWHVVGDAFTNHFTNSQVCAVHRF